MEQSRSRFTHPVYASGSEANVQGMASIRQHLAKEKNGRYLLGQHGHWHGGVHVSDASLTDALAEPVRAIADGDIIAYRLMEHDEVSQFQGMDYHYSTNFCLVRHQYPVPGTQTPFIFYSLYMHLRALTQFDNETCAWLESALSDSLQTAQPPIAVKAGDCLGYLGRFELPVNLQGDIESRQQVHLEVFSAERPPEALFAGQDGFVFMENDGDSPLQSPDENTPFLQQLLTYLGDSAAERPIAGRLDSVHAQYSERMEGIIVNHASEWHQAWDRPHQSWTGNIQGIMHAWMRSSQNSDERAERQNLYERSVELFSMNRERMKAFAFLADVGLPERLWHFHPFALVTHLSKHASFAPPVLLNLRNDAPPDAAKLLTPEQLEYFKENGNNACIFVHGYNVPLGQFGELQPKAFSSLRRMTATTYAPVAVPLASPIAYPHSELSNHLYRPAAEVPETHDPFDDEALNGSGAHGWLNHMEYQLNRAAGYPGHEEVSSTPYQRIIGIAWEGDVGALSFFGSTLNAITAGRRLARVLKQLFEAGIRVNMVSHSLGARVILTALNIVADSYEKAVDHVFLWQPAVADNALSTNTSADPHPLGLGGFPQAHAVAQQIVVLYSRRDGVLGGHTERGADTGSDIRSGNWAEAVTGQLGGAYNKQWWNIPIASAGVQVELDTLYQGYGQLQKIDVRDFTPSDIRHQPDKMQQARVQLEAMQRQFDIEYEANWQRLENAMRLEMRQKRHAPGVPDYRLLAPIAIDRVVDEETLNTYLQRLRSYYAGEHRERPRPALGYVGFEEVRLEDVFIRDKLEETEDFAVIDQTPWLFDHGGMKIPSEELFEKVYVEAIWKRFLSNSGFGLYEAEGDT